MELFLAIFLLACEITYTLYTMAWSFRIWMRSHQKVWSAAKNVCLELRVIMFVAIPADAWHYLSETHNGWFWRSIALVIYAGYLLAAILDKDDRWKKRRKKLLSKVKEVAGRLVVVPMPVPIPARI